MKEFVKMSRYAGMREDLVQAGGGNSAYKIREDKMVIKASGFQLSDITEFSGYSLVNPVVIRKAFLECENIELMTAENAKKIIEASYIEGPRPSIEIFLHSISGRYSLHTHPIVVNALTCRKNGESELRTLFPDAMIVPYAKPGIELAIEYFQAYKKYLCENKKEPKYIFLMNHGFITSSDSAEDTIISTELVTKKIEEYLGIDYSSYHVISELVELFDDGIIWRVTDSNVINTYQKLKRAWEYCFCPDCVVFLGRKIFISQEPHISKEEWNKFVFQNGYPTILLWNGIFYIHAESIKKALEIQSVLSFSAQVISLNSEKECQFLSEEQKDFLLNWEAEKYRKNMK